MGNCEKIDLAIAFDIPSLTVGVRYQPLTNPDGNGGDPRSGFFHSPLRGGLGTITQAPVRRSRLNSTFSRGSWHTGFDRVKEHIHGRSTILRPLALPHQIDGEAGGDGG